MINQGIMWFENDVKKSLDFIVKELFEYNKAKYNKNGNVCYVNPKLLPDGEIVINNIKVKPWKSILPNHYWLVIEK